MLRDYLGADAFKSGIVQYLHKYSYQNTKNEDLWNSIAGVSSLCGSIVWAVQSCRFTWCVFSVTSLTQRRATMSPTESGVMGVFWVSDLPSGWHAENGGLLL